MPEMAVAAAGQMPTMIFVINNGYENRYYVSVKSFATALVHGYADISNYPKSGYRNADIALFLPAAGVQVSLDEVFKYDLGEPATAEEWKVRGKAAKAHFEALLNDIIDNLPAQN